MPNRGRTGRSYPSMKEPSRGYAASIMMLEARGVGREVWSSEISGAAHSDHVDVYCESDLDDLDPWDGVIVLILGNYRDLLHKGDRRTSASRIGIHRPSVRSAATIRANWRATSASTGNGSHVDPTAESVATLAGRPVSLATSTPTVSSAMVTTETSVSVTPSISPRGRRDSLATKNEVSRRALIRRRSYPATDPEPLGGTLNLGRQRDEMRWREPRPPVPSTAVAKARSLRPDAGRR